MASKKPTAAPGPYAGGSPTVKLTATITVEADQRIRAAVFQAHGNQAAWWEHCGEWLIRHPEVLEEITACMQAELAGRRRRR